MRVVAVKRMARTRKEAGRVDEVKREDGIGDGGDESF
jgi:hypothetical protein